MRERDYRESRICRILGNPSAYQILGLLLDGAHRQPTEIAKVLDRSLPTVSMTLRILRNADLLRYEHQGRITRYWLKYPVEVRRMRAALLDIVERTTRRLRKDR